jgi:hypothetical protein
MRLFVDAIGGAEIAITGDNVGGIVLLCGEFEFNTI